MPAFDRARDTAARLGLDEALIRRLQARGYLLAFDLSEAEIRGNGCVHPPSITAVRL
jgi:hypothetical protein